MGKFFSCVLTILALAWFKPAIPVWFGVGLLMLVGMSAQYNFSAPSAKYRRSATKRMGFVLLLGLGLILSGAKTGSSTIYMGAASPEEARCLMLSLLVYCIATLGAPVVAWAYMSYPTCPKRRRAVVRTVGCSLPRLAEQNSNVQVKIAV